jgi:hypothetical protein
MGKVGDSDGVIPAGNALARLVQQSMRRQNLSSRDVERRGGPPARTVSMLADLSREWKQPPRPQTLQKLARALRVSLPRLQSAAAEATGVHMADFGLTEDVRLVVASMGEVGPEEQRAIADVVLRMVEALRTERPM